jgi:protein pelota
MKIIRSAISSKNSEGTVTLEAEEDEDMYHLYNLISKDDEVEALTIRNVVTENSNGVRDRSRVQVILINSQLQLPFAHIWSINQISKIDTHNHQS